MPERAISRIECRTRQVFPLGPHLHTYENTQTVRLLKDGRVSVGRLFDKYIPAQSHGAEIVFYRWDKGGHINPKDCLILSATDYERLKGGH